VMRNGVEGTDALPRLRFLPSDAFLVPPDPERPEVLWWRLLRRCSLWHSYHERHNHGWGSRGTAFRRPKKTPRSPDQHNSLPPFAPS
jgi:hypothetical protein